MIIDDVGVRLSETLVVHTCSYCFDNFECYWMQFIDFAFGTLSEPILWSVHLVTMQRSKSSISSFWPRKLTQNKHPLAEI